MLRHVEWACLAVPVEYVDLGIAVAIPENVPQQLGSIRRKSSQRLMLFVPQRRELRVLRPGTARCEFALWSWHSRM